MKLNFLEVAGLHTSPFIYRGNIIPSYNLNQLREAGQAPFSPAHSQEHSISSSLIQQRELLRPESFLAFGKISPSSVISLGKWIITVSVFQVFHVFHLHQGE